MSQVTTDMQSNNDLRSDLEKLGGAFLSTGANGVSWPEERTQLNYTGASGAELMKRTIDFIEVVHNNVPALESGQWRGLDYGVGWGRIASVMGHFGGPEQLDCADAWPQSLELAQRCGLRNRMLKTPAVLGPGDLPAEEYDLIYSYSIFTHLPEFHFVNNFQHLYRSLKPGGRMLLTVREPKFIEFLKRSAKYSPVDDRLDSDGFWFGNAQSADYGDSVVTPAWIQRHLQSFGRVTSLGVAKSEPFQSILLVHRPGP